MTIVNVIFYTKNSVEHVISFITQRMIMLDANYHTILRMVYP